MALNPDGGVGIKVTGKGGVKKKLNSSIIQLQEECLWPRER